MILLQLWFWSTSSSSLWHVYCSTYYSLLCSTWCSIVCSIVCSTLCPTLWSSICSTLWNILWSTLYKKHYNLYTLEETCYQSRNRLLYQVCNILLETGHNITVSCFCLIPIQITFWTEIIWLQRTKQKLFNNFKKHVKIYTFKVQPVKLMKSCLKSLNYMG